MGEAYRAYLELQKQAAVLTANARAHIKAQHFAVGQHLPIEDRKHTQLAWDMVERVKGLSGADKREAKIRIRQRARQLGMDISGWSRDAQKQAALHHYGIGAAAGAISGGLSGALFSKRDSEHSLGGNILRGAVAGTALGLGAGAGMHWHSTLPEGKLKSTVGHIGDLAGNLL